MKPKHTAAVGLIALFLALGAAAILWIGSAHVTPPVQTVTQSIPDDRIPH